MRVALHGECLLLRGHIPDHDEAILTGPGELPPIRTEAGVVGVLKSPPKRRRFLPRCRFPGLDCAVATSREDTTTVAIKTDASNIRRVVRKNSDKRVGVAILVVANVPYPHASVLAARGQRPSVRAERNLPDRLFVTSKRGKELARRRCPNANDPVVVPRRQIADRPGCRPRRGQAASRFAACASFRPVCESQILTLPSRQPVAISSAIGTEGRAKDSIGVLQGSSVAIALPLEEVPLPAAQFGRTLVEQFLRTADIAGGQLSLCQGNAPWIRRFLLAF